VLFCNAHFAQAKKVFAELFGKVAAAVSAGKMGWTYSVSISLLSANIMSSSMTGAVVCVSGEKGGELTISA
jgi:hypothetical protein